MVELMMELAERCERATGPDRELDRAIIAATDPHYNAMYTASLDAAMTLVPEGLDWVITKSGHHHYVILGTDLPEPLEAWSGRATTLAFALCAAALRARTKNTPDSQGGGA